LTFEPSSFQRGFPAVCTCKKAQDFERCHFEIVGRYFVREDSLSPGEFCFALLGLSLMFVYAAGAALAEWYFLEFVKHIIY